jgi:LPS sulfotransferase NodH
MPEPSCYLVLATPRSGSTLLGQGLKASGLAGDPKEFFGHKTPYWMERWRTPSLPAYVARLSQERATPNGVFGAKLLYRQLLHLEDLARHEPELTELPLPEILYRLFPNVHLVWVTRQDKVRQAISWFKARQTGVWGQDQGRSSPKLGRAWRLGDEPLQPGELAFDYDGIAALVRQAEAEDAAIGQFFATSGIEPFRVIYEEFTLPNPRTVKLADDRTDEWVARFRELQTAAASG